MSETITIKIDVGLSGFHMRQTAEMEVDRNDWEAMSEDERHKEVFDYVAAEMLDFGWEVQE